MEKNHDSDGKTWRSQRQTRSSIGLKSITGAKTIMPKPNPKPPSPTVLEYTLGIVPKTPVAPPPPTKPPRKAYTQAGLDIVLQTVRSFGRPVRLWEIVQANRDFANIHGLEKAARELVKQGKLSVSRDKDGNIYTLSEVKENGDQA